MKVAVLMVVLSSALAATTAAGHQKYWCQGFLCRDGTCILRHEYCDGNVDCNDDSDESLCECASNRFPKMYTCSNGQCIESMDMQCDGKKQCRDGSDEADCRAAKKSTTRPTTAAMTTGSIRKKETSTGHPNLIHSHKLMWIIVGTCAGTVVLVSCLSLLLIYLIVAGFAVKKLKDGQDHPMLLRYDSAGANEDKLEEEVSGDETTGLLEQPPSYQELERTHAKVDLAK